MFRKQLVLIGTLFFAAALIIAAYVHLYIDSKGSLEKLREVARHAPIVSATTVDPDTLAAVARDLSRTQKQLATIQSNSQSNRAVFSSLYPTNFLISLAQTEQARLDFISSGKKIDAWNYYRSAYRTLVQYERDITKFRNTFDIIVPNNIGDYAVPQKIISREHFLATLDQYTSNALLARQQLALEKRCLTGNSNECQQALTDSVDREIQSNQESSEQSDLLLDKLGSSLALQIQDLLQESGYSLSTENSTIIEGPESRCSVSDNEHAFFELVTHENIGELLLPRYNLRFIKNDTQTEIPFFTYLATQGVKYTPILPNFYTCLEIGFDYASAYDSFTDRNSRGVSGLIPLTRDIILTENDAVRAVQEGVPVKLSAPTLFFVRSGALSFFGIGNRMMGYPPVSLFKENTIPQDRQPYVPYSSILNDTAALEILPENITNYIRIMRKSPTTSL